jgi:glycerophosphoryl diester phosphodiesterase
MRFTYELKQNPDARMVHRGSFYTLIMKINTFTLIMGTLWLASGTIVANANLPGGFVIQTHRCGGALGPENTFESCQFSWQLGTIPEVDVRTTADGVLLAFHDKDFSRVVKNLPVAFTGKGIGDFTYADLQQLDVGAYKGEYFEGQRIPSLESIFEEMRLHPRYRLYLDIKEVELDTLAAIVSAYGLDSRVILSSTDYDLIQKWSQLLPLSHTLYWMGGLEPELRKRIDALEKEDFKGITQLQIHVRKMEDPSSADAFYPSPSFLWELGKKLGAHGIVFQALPWMPDSIIYEALMDLGVESFATDYPQRTIHAVSHYYETHN